MKDEWGSIWRLSAISESPAAELEVPLPPLLTLELDPGFDKSPGPVIAANKGWTISSNTSLILFFTSDTMFSFI